MTIIQDLNPLINNWIYPPSLHERVTQFFKKSSSLDTLPSFVLGHIGSFLPDDTCMKFLRCAKKIKDDKKVVVATLSGRNDLVKKVLGKDIVFEQLGLLHTPGVLESITSFDLSRRKYLAHEKLHIIATRFLRLQRLDFSFTTLSKESLKAFSSHQNLLEIDLRGTDVDDDDLRALTKIKTVKRLDLTMCENISATGIKALASLQLEVLELGITKTNDACLEALGTIKSLKKLGLRSCQITKVGMRAFINHPNLQHISLFDNRNIDNDCLESIGTIQSLVTVDLRSCEKIIRAAMKAFAFHPNLKNFLLCDTNIEDVDIESIGTIKSLEILVLTRCKKITSVSMKFLLDTPHLKALILSRTNIDDAGVKTIGAIKSLTALDLGGCEHITDQGVQSLAVLPNLEALDLRNTRITDMGTPIGEIFYPNLHTLHLIGTSIVDTSLEKIGNIKKLHTLTIDECPKITDVAVQKFKKDRPDIACFL